MAEKLARLIVSLEAEAARYKRGMDQAQTRLNKFQKAQARGTNQIVSSFKQMAVQVGAIVGGISLGSKFVEIARETDILKAQLRTATGSIEGAAGAFEELENFAARTPFALEQSVAGFTKLVNLGLTPSERAMTSYGNTASALGKQLNDMIEAVADASVGEFERLKEFGIKAASEGDKVTFRFRGQAVTVAKTAEEIERYLIAIGENEFAGALEERSRSLDGALSNLGDSVDGLFRAFAGAGGSESLATIARESGSAFDDLARAFGDVSSDGSIVETVAEGIGHALRFTGVLAAQLGTSFEKIGNTIGTLAAAATLIVTGDFSSIPVIFEALTKKNEALNAELDATILRMQGLQRGENGEVTNIPKKAGVDLGSFKQGGETDPNALTKEQQEAFDNYNRMLMEAAESSKYAVLGMTQNWMDHTAEIDKQVETQKDAILRARENMESLFTENMVSAAAGSFDEIVKSWGRMLQQMLAKAVASKIFDFIMGFGTNAAGGQNWFGQAMTSFFGGARASGGPVSGNRAYLVGERGPELFVPRSAGSIVANGAMAAPKIVINTPPGVVTSTEQRMGQNEMVTIINQAIEQKLTGDIANGVGVARVLEGRYGLRR